MIQIKKMDAENYYYVNSKRAKKKDKRINKLKKETHRLWKKT